MAYSGLGLHLGNLSRLSTAKTRSISPENFTGDKGKAGMSTDGAAAQAARGLGQGWKVSPYILIEPGATFTLADVKARLIDNTQAAVERGAFGAPTFFVDKEMFFGKEQLREVEEMVRKGE